MRVFAPVFAACVALFEGAAVASQEPPIPFAKSEEAFVQTNLHSYRKRTALPLQAVAFLTAAVATVFLIFRCLKFLQSEGYTSNSGIKMRRLAVGDSGSCIVCLCKRNLGNNSTQISIRPLYF